MDQRIEYIERFFTGNLSETEKSEFERLRSEDKSFNEEVVLYLKAREIIRHHAGKRMKQQLDNIGKQQFTPEMVKPDAGYRVLRQPWLSIAASVIVIGALAYFALSGILRQSKVDSYLAVYDRYFEKPGIGQVITRGSVEDDLSALWYAALEKYSNSNYSGAVEDFRSLLGSAEFSQRSAASFYAGVSFMNLNMPDSAVAFFNDVSASSSFTFDATWHTALSHIKSGNTAKAREILNQIKDIENHPRRKDAAKVLRDISRVERRR